MLFCFTFLPQIGHETMVRWHVLTPVSIIPKEMVREPETRYHHATSGGRMVLLIDSVEKWRRHDALQLARDAFPFDRLALDVFIYLVLSSFTSTLCPFHVIHFFNPLRRSLAVSSTSSFLQTANLNQSSARWVFSSV
jgi:hypothetical protein